MSSNDLRTTAIILKRTNYGEADRILKLLTPVGLKSAIAKSVRKEKSRLAGGIELFCLSDVVLRAGKSDLNVLTSAKMLKFYQDITADLAKLTLASEILKKIGKLADQIAGPELFDIARQSLEGINSGLSLPLVDFWSILQLFRVSGETLNLHFDSNGAKLSATSHYFWDTTSLALTPALNGNLDARHIKLLRLTSVSPLEVLSKVQQIQPLLSDLEYVTRSLHF